MESLQIQDFADFEVVIVDQASRDGTEQYLDHFATSQDHLKLKVFYCGTKIPWTLANQIGIDNSRGEWLAISNPDIVFPQGSLRLLSEWAEREGYAVLGCNLGGNPMKRLSLANIFHVSSHRTLGTFLDRKVWRRFFERHFIQSTIGFQGIAEVEHLQMSFFMVRKSIINDVVWDERFRWVCADSDLLSKAKQKGISQLYNHDITLLHEGEFSRKTSPKPEYEYEYAYGYTIYAKNWLHVSTLRLLFFIDALAAPFLLRLAGQDSFRNQILCSAAKVRGLLA